LKTTKSQALFLLKWHSCPHWLSCKLIYLICFSPLFLIDTAFVLKQKSPKQWHQWHLTDPTRKHVSVANSVNALLVSQSVVVI
jgi:hypothetical protein